MLEVVSSADEVRNCNLMALCPLGLLSRSPIKGDGLNEDSRIVVDAAGYLHDGGMRLIPSGNDRAGFPQAAQSFWERNYGYINPELYDRVDGRSPDTKLSVKNLPMLLGELGIGAAALVTAGYHAERVSRLFKGEESIIPVVVVAEAILAERTVEDREQMADFVNSRHYRHETNMEKLAIRLSFAQPLGSLLVRKLRKYTLEHKKNDNKTT